MKREVVAEVSHKNQKTLLVDFQVFKIKKTSFCKELA